MSMNSVELDMREDVFHERKDAKFPPIGFIRRDESRTVKFPMPLQTRHAGH